MGAIERRAGDIPASLEAAGVKIEERDGFRAITFPPSIHETHNVLMPVESIGQSDPLYRPSLRQVRLTKDHTYPQDRKFALNKQGLLALAQAAGAEVRTGRMPREGLMGNEIGWEARLLIRRGDGTNTVYQASRVIDLMEMKERIRRASTNADTGEINEGGFQNRWARERETIDSMLETKAILRAIRQALQIKGTYDSLAQILKPWIVVVYDFAPDYADPEVKRMAVERGFGATQGLYAPMRVELEAAHAREAARELTPATNWHDIAAADIIEAAAEDVRDEDVRDVVEDAQPNPRAEQALEAGQMMIPGGKHTGKTIAEAATADPDFVRTAAGRVKDETLRDAFILYTEVFLSHEQS